MYKIDITKHFESLNFEAIYWGIKNDIIDTNAAIEYADAYAIANTDECSQSVIEILLSEDITKEEMLMLLKKASGLKVLQSETKCMFILRILILSELQNKSSNELLLKLEKVYADFDYPSDMNDFIYDMPPEDGYDPSAHSDKENEARLINKFNEFINTWKEKI